MRSSTLPSNSRSIRALADTALHESTEQRRARLQALLNDVVDLHRITVIQLEQTQRVVADCETAVTRLSAMLQELNGEPDTSVSIDPN